MGDAMPSDARAVPGLGLSGRRVDDLPGLRTEAPDMLRGSGCEPAPGPDPDQRGVLARAVALRFPNLTGLAGREKIDALVDHIMATAIARGELEELRLEAHVRLREVSVRLAAVPATTARSKALAQESRRALAPDLAREADLSQWVVDRCTEQINRLGGSDYDAASRSYTLLAG